MAWNRLAERVLANDPISRDEALRVVRSHDDELLLVLQAAFKVRRAGFGRKVQVHVLQNAKSGACPEDCGFCSQATRHPSNIDRFPMQSPDTLVQGARDAVALGAVTYCIVTSTRGPSAMEIDRVCAAAKIIRSEFPTLRICTSLGMLDPSQAQQLAQAGVTRYNHNLEASKSFFPSMITTHTFEDRVTTLGIAKDAGLELCSGGIVGLGEDLEDRVDLALELRTQGVHAVPLNFFDPIPGTPMGNRPRISPTEALRTLAMFRLVHPSTDLRVAGGRESCLGSMQPLALYAASSLFTEGYLTTDGQGHNKDWAMMADAGFEPAVVSA